MKLCIPVRVPNGLESCTEPHLPNAEHLIIFDTATRGFEQVSLRDFPENAAGSIRIDAVLCSSVDAVTRDSLVERNILAFGTEARTAAQAIAEFEESDWNLSGQESGRCGGHAHGHEGGGCGCQGKGHGGGCGGHGHEHGHGHEGGGCGCGSHDHGRDAAPKKKPSDVLRIAVTSQNRKTVTEHAGRCRKFWVYEFRNDRLNSKTLLELTLDETLHSASLREKHPLDDVHVLITAGMSPFLYQRLQRSGIKGYVTEETDPDRAVELLLQKVAQS